MKESENENEGDDELVTPKTLVFAKASSSFESHLPNDVKDFLIKFDEFKTSSRFSFMKTKHVHHDEAVKDGRYQSLRNDFIREKSNFLEVAYLLLNGELPTTNQYKYFSQKITNHSLDKKLF